MNSCLQKELERFNKLLRTIRNSLAELVQAVDGVVVLSEDMKILLDEVLSN